MEQVDGTSLQTQVETCERYARGCGYRVIDRFVDEGVSGAKASRPALDRLMSRVRSGDVDAIVVAKLDRFGRSMRHLSELLGQLDDLGITFVSVAESFDSSSASGRLQRNILGSFAEFEREQIKDRMMSGHLAIARQGYWWGGRPPYGFQLVRVGKHSKLEINEEEADNLREIIRLVVDDRCSLSETARILNARGIQTREGKEWMAPRIRLLLRGMVPLCGVYDCLPAGGRHKTTTYAGAGISGMFTIEVPRLISDQRKRALDRALLRIGTGEKRATYDYLLSGMESRCGSYYKGKLAHGKYRYRCAAIGCGCPTVSARVEDAVWGEVATLLSDSDRLDAILSRFQKASSGKRVLEAESVKSIDARIVKLERNLTAEVKKYLKAGVAADAVRQATSDVQSEIEQLRIYRDRLVAHAKRSKAGDDNSRRWLPEKLEHATTKERRAILSLLQITVRITEFSTCSRCNGSGTVSGISQSGKRTGVICPGCEGLRYIPIVELHGVIPESILDASQIVQLEQAEHGWPFQQKIG
jgi:site-specific DNA recombinase